MQDKIIAANSIGQAQNRKVNIDKPSHVDGRGGADGKMTVCVA